MSLPCGNLSRRAVLHFGVSSVVGAVFFSACGQATPAAPTSVPSTTAPQPTSAPPPTLSPAPTATTPPTAQPAVAPTVAPQPTSTPVAQASPKPTGKQGKIILSTFQFSAGNVDRDQLEAVINAYKKVQPGVDITLEFAPGGNNNAAYTTWLSTQLAAGVAGGAIRPDIVTGFFAPTFQGYLDYGQYRTAVNPYTGNPWENDLNFDVYKWSNAKGEIYALNMGIGPNFWFYNKDMYDKVGINPPKSWQEFVDNCAKLKDAGITPLFINYVWQANQWMPEVYFDQYHVDWVETVRAQPGDWNYNPSLDDKFKFDANDPFIHTKYTYNAQRFYKAVRDGKLRYDTPALAEMVKNTAQAWPKYAEADMFVAAQDQYPPFLQQQVAMMPHGTYAFGALTADLKEMTAARRQELKLGSDVKIKPFNWDIFDFPSMQGSLVKCPAKAVAGTGPGPSIIKKSPDQTALDLDFLMFWFSKPGYQLVVDALVKDGVVPGLLTVSGVEAQRPPEIQKWYDKVHLIGNAEINYNTLLYFGVQGAPTDPLTRDSQNKFKDAIQLKLKPEDFAKWYQDYFTSNIDKVLHLTGLTPADLENPARQPGT